MRAPRHSLNLLSSKARLISPLILILLLNFITLTSKAERLPVKIYTSADGLGSSAAFTLVRDPRGFIWLCSRDGLVRFDGYRFITYRIGNDNADPAVATLLPTRNSGYWIDLNRGTDYRFIAKDDATLLEPIQQQVAKNDPRIPLDVEPLTDLPMPSFEDSLGNLWTSDDKGVYLMSEVDGRLVTQPIELRLPGNPGVSFAFTVFHEASDRSLWIGTNWGLVRRLPDGRQIHFSISPQNERDPASLLAEDKDGRIWIARQDGLFVLKVEPMSELTALSDFTARKVVVRPGKVASGGQAQLPEKAGEAAAFRFADLLRGHAKATATAIPYGLLSASDGRVWIATSSGLIVFDNTHFRHFPVQQGLGQTPLTYIAEDNEGQLWLLSHTGLIRLNPKGFTSFDQTDGLAYATVHAIYEDRNGALHVVTDRSSLNRLQDGVFKTASPRLPLDATWQWHSNEALLDSRGDWWVITTGRIYRYSGVSKIEEIANRQPTAVYDDSNGLIGDYNFRIFEDSKGDIWISNFSHSKRMSMTRWQRSTERFQHFFTEDGLPQIVSASALAEDKAGNLWFGFYEGGIARYRDGRFTALGVDDGIPPGMITSLYADKSGRLWIASNVGGLSRVDSPEADRPVFRRYTINDGLTSNNVRCITEDLFGNIYVGTVRGVNRLSPDTGQIKYYGTGDGLASDFVNVAYRDRGGALWFGTFSGLSRLVPEPDPPSQPPPILISGLNIAGLDYSVSPLGQKEVFVPEQAAAQNSIRIEFSSIATSGSATTRYQYKLEGADSDWSQPTVERSITFANLSPGAYRFLVRAIKADDVASLQPAFVSFTILPPVWQRWWFLLLVALATSLLAYALYRYRLRRFIEMERVRTRIATDLHDDIGSNLSLIAMVSEVARTQISQTSAPITDQLSLVARTSRQSVDAMSDIVWAVNPKRDHLHDLIERMRRFASDTFAARDIEFDFAAPSSKSDMKLGSEFRRQAYMIFKEAVNNCAKHANCTKACIVLVISGGHLTLRLSDNGRGFDAASPGNGYGGNGLSSMSQRAAALGGTLDIVSEKGAGTTITLKAPLGRR